MRVGFGKAIGLCAAVALMAAPALAQTKLTNQGISDTEIVIGTHQDLSGPIKGWGVSVANGMKMAVDLAQSADCRRATGRWRRRPSPIQEPARRDSSIWHAPCLR